MTAGSAGLAPTVESSCGKVAYRSRVWANRAAEDHRESSGPCRQCSRGYPMKAYHCDNGAHFHVGHSRKARP